MSSLTYSSSDPSAENGVTSSTTRTSPPCTPPAAPRVPGFCCSQIRAGVRSPWFAVDDDFLVTSLPELSTRWMHCGTRASCHGLLSFKGPRHGTTSLVNPLTREIVPLLSADPLRKQICSHSVGSGMDRLTSQYKILRLSRISAEVLDQGLRSWRAIASVPPSPSLLHEYPLFAAGSFHGGMPKKVVRILSFDISKEEFLPTSCPQLQYPHLIKEYSIRLFPPLPESSLRHLNSLWFYDPATDELRNEHRAGALSARIVCSVTESLLSLVERKG
ncbi:hypothetical protein ACJRO7_003673 [Eucalyptus globulus]|uniref:Uncharacterized protein n=1 Tax=Eucalyptus globulus TaxID=34317 RepID=A0ABD3IZ77_EUCGL